jgi:carbonic anhydrase/acetyltransferase-like protein (isoleucine patch superfamily)
MAIIRSVQGISPIIGEDCFLADNAVITGDVIIGNQCTLWFNAVIRGDVHEIRIGNRTNIQDGAIIHATYKKAHTYIGDDVSIAHGAMIHGCTIENEVLIGMGAIIMDHVVIPSGCVVAAGAVVLEGSHLESGFSYGGVPARKLGKLSDDQRQFLIKRTAENYIKYASWYEES